MSEFESNWDIQIDGRKTNAEREAYWGHAHATDDYETIFSITQDSSVCKSLSAAVRQAVGPDPGIILIPGCGSRIGLQEHLLAAFPSCRLISTDFPAVVEVAKDRLKDERAEFIGMNSTTLDLGEEVDAVVVVNSVLSDDHEENAGMIRSFYDTLKPGGSLIGLFPTVLATVDIAYIEGAPSERIQQADLANSAFFENDQDLWQIFYTPLRLRQMVKEAGFENLIMALEFFDSDEMLDHAGEYYGIDDRNLPVYELLVSASRPDRDS